MDPLEAATKLFGKKMDDKAKELLKLAEKSKAAGTMAMISAKDTMAKSLFKRDWRLLPSPDRMDTHDATLAQPWLVCMTKLS